MNSKDEIKQYVSLNLAKLYSSNSLPIGIDNMKRLISQLSNQENKLLLILALINDHISIEQKNMRKEYIKLLALFTTVNPNPEDFSIAFLSKVFTVMQSNINQELSCLYSTINSTFGEIVESLFLNDENIISKSEENSKVSNLYELIQGFCIYNLKQDEKGCNIVGALCLNTLIQGCPIVLQPSYLNYIWKSIISNLEKDKYPAKVELLNALISLIFACEDTFCPLAGRTLNKILDFLNDDDWIKKKLALNVIFTLCTYCLDEISDLHDQIVSCLKLLKNDKVKEIRDISIQTLKLISDQLNKSNLTNSSAVKENSYVAKKPIVQQPKINSRAAQHQVNDAPIRKIQSIIQPQEHHQLQLNKQNPNHNYEVDNIKQETKKVLSNISKISEIFDRNNSADKKTELSTPAVAPARNNIIATRRPIKKELDKNSKDNLNNRSADSKDLVIKKNKNFKDAPQATLESKIIGIGGGKMNLKKDPNHSIFKTKPNISFFNNFDNGKDIEIKVKSKDDASLSNDIMDLKPQLNFAKEVILKTAVPNRADEFNMRNEQEFDNYEDISNVDKLRIGNDVKSQPLISSINKEISPKETFQIHYASPNPPEHKHETSDVKDKKTSSNSANNDSILIQLKALSEMQMKLMDRLEKLDVRQSEEMINFMDRVRVLELAITNQNQADNSSKPFILQEKEELSLASVLGLLKKNLPQEALQDALTLFELDNSVLIKILDKLSKLKLIIIKRHSHFKDRHLNY